MNDITKKLQKMVSSRKDSVVISEQKKYNQYSRKNRNSTSFSDYQYSYTEDN